MAERRQIEKFRDLAREAECDDDESAFDKKLKRIAKPKSQKVEKQKKKKPA